MVDSPSGRVPAKAPRWDLADTKVTVAKYFSGGSLDVFRVHRLIWEEEVRRWRPEGPTREGARPIGGAPSYLVEASAAS